MVKIDVFLAEVCVPALLDFKLKKHNCLLRDISTGSLVDLVWLACNIEDCLKVAIVGLRLLDEVLSVSSSLVI